MCLYLASSITKVLLYIFPHHKHILKKLTNSCNIQIQTIADYSNWVSRFTLGPLYLLITKNYATC